MMWRGKHQRHVIVTRAEALGWGAALARWEYHGRPTAPVFLLFVDGEPEGETEETRLAISGVRPGGAHQVDVAAVSAIQARRFDFSGRYYAPRRGSRLQVSVAAVDLAANPDFYSYLIYMSADGSEPTELAAELVGANNNTWISEALTDGVTYKFRTKLKDAQGNTSAYGATTSGTVNAAPAGVDDAAAVYDAETRTVTVTATAPAGQAADVLGYFVFTNHLPGYGLQAGLVTPAAHFFPAGTAISWTSAELSEGVWRFAVKAVDTAGILSDATELTLNLLKSNGELIEHGTVPAAPTFIDATPIVEGAIRVRVKVDDPEGLAFIQVYRDGVYDGSVAVEAGVYEYAYDTPSGLTQGQSYAFYATAMTAVGVESAPTETVEATADSEAPTGTGAVTLERVE